MRRYLIKQKKKVIMLGMYTVFFYIQLCWGQAPLSVGDTCPDLPFRYYFNKEMTSRNMHDYKGKWIILDFWASYCGGCIKGLNELAEIVHEDLVVLPVSTEPPEKAIAFWNRNHITSVLPMGTVIGTTDFDILFPRESVPHYVVLDPWSRVYAITYKEFMTYENIHALLAGKDVEFADKTIHWRRDVDAAEAETTCSDSVGRAHIRMYDPLKIPSSGAFQVDTLVDCLRVKINNNSIYDLYLKTLEPQYAHLNKLRVIIGVDSVDLFYRKSSGHYRIDWMKENTYCYEAIFDKKQGLDFIKEKIRMDLDSYFKLKGAIKQISQVVWKLSYSKGVPIDTSFSENNRMTLEGLRHALNTNKMLPYVIFSGGLDMHHTATIYGSDDGARQQGPKHVLEWLERVGFNVEETTELVPCFVLSKAF